MNFRHCDARPLREDGDRKVVRNVGTLSQHGVGVAQHEFCHCLSKAQCQ
jgi:hypothetical protein